MITALDHAARPGAGGTDADELRMLRDSAIAFCARESGLARVRGLRGTRPGFDPAVWKKMADQGWLGILLPESFGGSELGCAAMRVVAEELARAHAGAACRMRCACTWRLLSATTTPCGNPCCRSSQRAI